MRTTFSKATARRWTNSRFVRSGTSIIERSDEKRSRRTRFHSRAVEERRGGWEVVPKLLFAGAVIGPLLDCIHTSVGLLEYDVAPVSVGSLKSSATVPVLLSSYYAVLGCLHLQLPRLFKEWERSPAMPSNERTTTISLICLASMLETSSVLFARKASMPFTYAILATLGIGNWYAFDRRAWTFVLGALVSVAAPASEVILMKLLGLWHYPSGDIVLGGEPFPSWVFLCYFFYTPFVSQLALYFAQQTSQGESK